MTRDLNGRFHLKLADFGFTTTATPSRIREVLRERGTTPYLAPEIVLHHEFSEKGDIWAVGCILYEFLLCCFDRRQTFSSLTAVALYYHDGNMAPPQITWETLGIDPGGLPASVQGYRPEIEREWEVFNGVARLVFARGAAERPDAKTLRERKEEWMMGNPVDA